jgi:hypothetical protein
MGLMSGLVGRLRGRHSLLASLAISLVMSGAFAQADEWIQPREAIRLQGFRPAQEPGSRTASERFASQIDKEISAELSKETSIDWPVAFQDESHSMGNAMAQFQDYGDGAYHHGGCDLRTRAGEVILAPDSGRVEAFYYTYELQENGSLKKSTRETGGQKLYYEVAIINSNGLRYEIHHIDPTRLSNELKRVLSSPDRQILKGTPLGQVVSWPLEGVDGQKYHHIHFNIIAPNGQHLNPEAFAPPLKDTTAPTIAKVFAVVAGSSRAKILKSGDLLPAGATEVLIQGWDKKDLNVYTQPLAKIEVTIGGQRVPGWDFSQALVGQNGEFPDIRNVYASQIRGDDGRTYRTRGDYTASEFIYRVSLPRSLSGAVQVRVLDQASNEARF